MKKLIDSKEVAKLMKEAAKECGMTRVYSSTDNVWWAKEEELAQGGVKDYECSYRRIVKAYDFIADNFIELLETKIQAKGFDSSDNEIKLSDCKAHYRNWTDKDYSETIDSWKKANKEALADPLSFPQPPQAPIVKSKIYGSTYLRMLVSFKETYRSISKDELARISRLENC